MKLADCVPQVRAQRLVGITGAEQNCENRFEMQRYKSLSHEDGK